MRVQFFAAALVIAAAGLAGMAALSVQAASNLNSSKSNIYRPITSAAGEVACARAGGTVVLQNRTKVCSIPPVGTDTNSGSKQLCSNPDGSSSCCRAWGGTWVTGGSDGFCYRNL